MNAMYVGVAAGALLLFGFMMKRHRRKTTTLDKAKAGLEEIFSEFESKSQTLRKRAKKASGEARKRIDAQVHELDERKKELRGRLEELGAEARHALSSAASDAESKAGAHR